MKDKQIKTISLQQFAEAVKGNIIQHENTIDSEIKGINTLENANAGEISFISSAKFLKQAEESKASFFITSPDIIVKSKPCVQLKEVWKGVLFLMKHFYPEETPDGNIHETAIIGNNVELGEKVTIGPYSVIADNVKIGSNTIVGAYTYIGKNAIVGTNCLFHPRVTIMKEVIIGNRVILHPGAVIGSDGFKYEMIEGRIQKIPQVGTVILEDEVEIGANTTVDRATLTQTKIGAFTKIDNLVQIAHNVVIGKGCLIVSQVGIAGSTKVGNGCIFGGQAGIADNVDICDRVVLAARGAIKNDIKNPGEYIGAPAMPAKEGIRVILSQIHLPETIKKVRELSKEVEKLRKNID